MKLFVLFLNLLFSCEAFSGSDFFAEKYINTFWQEVNEKSLAKDIMKQLIASNNSAIDSSIFSQYESVLEIICKEEWKDFLDALKIQLKNQYTDQEIELYIKVFAGPISQKAITQTALTEEERLTLKNAGESGLLAKANSLHTFSENQLALVFERAISRYFAIIEKPLSSMGYTATLKKLGNGHYFIQIQ